MAFILVLRSQDDDEPIDPSIYMITTALGFAAVENVLFLMQAQVKSGSIKSLCHDSAYRRQPLHRGNAPAHGIFGDHRTVHRLQSL